MKKKLKNDDAVHHCFYIFGAWQDRLLGLRCHVADPVVEIAAAHDAKPFVEGLRLLRLFGGRGLIG